MGAPTLRGAPTYDFAKFSQKLHEIERIWTPGGRPKCYYVDPPLLFNIEKFQCSSDHPSIKFACAASTVVDTRFLFSYKDFIHRPPL